jgi:peptide/nickel transport system substrate-binding protein
MKRAAWRLAMIGAAVAALLSAFAGSSYGSESKATGGTVTYASSTFASPVSNIFPLVSIENAIPSNFQATDLLWTPLYWFGQKGSLTYDPKLSLAEAPRYSDGNREVTITLKNSAKWSDGQPVTSRDVEFEINLAKADESSLFEYVPGEFPADISSVTIDSAKTFTLNLTGAFSTEWFTQSQLYWLAAFPQHAWDKTSTSGPTGSDDMTPAGATQVLNYLVDQAKNPNTYASNPLWKVVDGPWKLSEFKTDGYAVFVPNTAYEVGPKPTLAKFIMQPFSSDAAEANDLATGALTYGYVPISDLSAKARFEAQGYKLYPWPLLSLSGITINFNNPTIGPAFQQLYVRQALEDLIDQKGDINAFLGQAGFPTVGPIPSVVKVPGVPAPPTNPYPYSPSKAKDLLTAHGWNVVANGTTTCADAGTGANQCGAGIVQGTKLAFSVLYPSGSPSLQNEMDTLKSDMSRDGIDVAVQADTLAQVVSTALPCTSGPSCAWQAIDYGSPGDYSLMPYPIGDEFFETGAPSNIGNFSSPAVDADIVALRTAPTAAAETAAWKTYDTDVTDQLPQLWMPNAVAQVSAISTKLSGATPQNPLFMIYPSTWSLAK